jgi:hypothetical protein
MEQADLVLRVFDPREVLSASCVRTGRRKGSGMITRHCLPSFLLSRSMSMDHRQSNEQTTLHDVYWSMAGMGHEIPGLTMMLGGMWEFE